MSTYRWTLICLIIVGVALLTFGYRANTFSWLPYILLAACPLMHIFMHKKHNHQHDSNAPQDPVCGMPATSKVTYTYQGKTYMFCSEHCKQTFEKDPKAYITK
jgi:YHS domain-containing protein